MQHQPAAYGSGAKTAASFPDRKKKSGMKQIIRFRWIEAGAQINWLLIKRHVQLLRRYHIICNDIIRR